MKSFTESEVSRLRCENPTTGVVGLHLGECMFYCGAYLTGKEKRRQGKCIAVCAAKLFIYYLCFL